MSKGDFILVPIFLLYLYNERLTLSWRLICIEYGDSIVLTMGRTVPKEGNDLIKRGTLVRNETKNSNEQINTLITVKFKKLN